MSIAIQERPSYQEGMFVLTITAIYLIAGGPGYFSTTRCLTR